MSEEKKQLHDQNLDEINAGFSGYKNGFYMTVSDLDEPFLALRNKPAMKKSKALSTLFPGARVYTYGQIIEGTSKAGRPCAYRYVSYKGLWGYVDAKYLS